MVVAQDGGVYRSPYQIYLIQVSERPGRWGSASSLLTPRSIDGEEKVASLDLAPSLRLRENPWHILCKHFNEFLPLNRRG